MNHIRRSRQEAPTWPAPGGKRHRSRQPAHTAQGSVLRPSPLLAQASRAASVNHHAVGWLRRLLHRSHVLNICGESYRLREKRQAGLFPSHQQLSAAPEEAGDNHAD